jgi:hypothetical protein
LPTTQVIVLLDSIVVSKTLEVETIAAQLSEMCAMTKVFGSNPRYGYGMLFLFCFLKMVFKCRFIYSSLVLLISKYRVVIV